MSCRELEFREEVQGGDGCFGGTGMYLVMEATAWMRTSTEETTGVRQAALTA